MISIKNIRLKNRISQRGLAKMAGVSYKALQLIEKGGDLRLSTLGKIAQGFGFAKKSPSDFIALFFETPPQAIAMISGHWKLSLFDFVDTFRKTEDPHLIERPPDTRLSFPLRALLASTVETLCDEKKISYPDWCLGTRPLKNPWFPSEIENLKATALIESQVHFRKRNIFVLGNFLERA